ncbi:ABC transporter permease [Paenibacillus apiarius]|uniref:ABC transporter permease n=1 Tax=Paenibacillus apiarius TaxID=46240 RepID=UPI003B3BCDAA
MKLTKWLAAVACVYLALLLVFSFAAPFITGHDPVDVDLGSILQPPQPGHLMGTDEMGRDIVSRLLYGARVSLSVGFASMLVSLVAGVVYGTVSGYCGGWIDRIMMRLLDTLLSTPSLLIMIGAQAILSPGLLTVVLVIGLTGWMPLARLIRTEMFERKEEVFIQASIVAGASPYRLFVRHLAPHSLPTILVMSASGVGHAILSESTLSFLGLGIPPHEASWGNMLVGAQNHLLTGAWWAVAFPGAGIVLTVLAITFLGDWLQSRHGSPQFRNKWKGEKEHVC